MKGGARRRWIWLTGAVLLALVLSRNVWLGALGGLLVNAEPPQKSDLIVVLAGDQFGRRIVFGAELVRQGYASQVLVSGPPNLYGFHEHELAIPFAVKRGYPEGIFIGFPVEGANNTEEEARRILPELRRRGVKRALVVTSDYHTRRASRVYRRQGRDIEVHVVAAPDAVFRADRWWMSREGRKVFFLEFVKLVTSVFGI